MKLHHLWPAYNMSEGSKRTIMCNGVNVLPPAGEGRDAKSRAGDTGRHVANLVERTLTQDPPLPTWTARGATPRRGISM